MAITTKQLEADNFKRQVNTLQRNKVQNNQTAEQRAIAHSNQSLNSLNTIDKNSRKPKSSTFAPGNV